MYINIQVSKETETYLTETAHFVNMTTEILNFQLEFFRKYQISSMNIEWNANILFLSSFGFISIGYTYIED